MSAVGRLIRPPGGGQGCDRQSAWIDITIIGKPTFGDFDLRWVINDVAETITFDFDETAITFAAKLVTHSQIASIDIGIPSGLFPNTTMRVVFQNALANKDIELPTADWDNLGGGLGVAVICATAQKGHS